MGALADAALAAGGDVAGVIPQSLVDREIAHPGLTELHVVGSMHERKALMAELSDGFIALPSGTGTLDELFEVYTWTQLGLQAKPLGLLDVRGYFARLAETGIALRDLPGHPYLRVSAGAWNDEFDLERLLSAL